MQLLFVGQSWIPSASWQWAQDVGLMHASHVSAQKKRNLLTFIQGLHQMLLGTLCTSTFVWMVLPWLLWQLLLLNSMLLHEFILLINMHVNSWYIWFQSTVIWTHVEVLWVYIIMNLYTCKCIVWWYTFISMFIWIHMTMNSYHST